MKTQYLDKNLLHSSYAQKHSIKQIDMNPCLISPYLKIFNEEFLSDYKFIVFDVIFRIILQMYPLNTNKRSSTFDNIDCRCFGGLEQMNKYFLQKQKPNFQVPPTINPPLDQYMYRQPSKKILCKKSLKRQGSPQVKGQPQTIITNSCEYMSSTHESHVQVIGRASSEPYTPQRRPRQYQQVSFSGAAKNDQKFQRIPLLLAESCPDQRQSPKPQIKFNIHAKGATLSSSSEIDSPLLKKKGAVENTHNELVLQDGFYIRKTVSQKPQAQKERTSLKLQRKQSINLMNSAKSDRSTICKGKYQGEFESYHQKNFTNRFQTNKTFNFAEDQAQQKTLIIPITQSDGTLGQMNKHSIQKSYMTSKKSMITDSQSKIIIKVENTKILERMADVEELRSLPDEDEMGWSEQQSIVLDRMNSLIDPLLDENFVTNSKMVSDKTLPSLHSPSRVIHHGSL